MKQRLLLFLSALLAVVPLVQAQPTPVAVTATEPADGTTGVPLTTVVSFTLDHPVDAEAFWDLVEVHPADSIEVDVESIVVSDDGLTISFEVTHRPQTDYLWIFFGRGYYDEAAGSPYAVEPFVLRYTTADAFGTYTISGTVSYEAATGKTTTIRPPLFHESHLFGQTKRPESPLTREALERLGATFQAAGKAGVLPVPGPEGTVVVLSTCNLFACEEAGDDGFPFAAATVVNDPSGAYGISHVRAGTYYVFAAHFGAHDPLPGEKGGFPAYLGFYDANGDGTPDPIEVAADLEGVDIALFDIMALATTAGPAYEEAVAKAAEIADDQVLLAVQSGPLTPEGTTLEGWIFVFYSPSTAQITVVAVGPFQTWVETESIEPLDFVAPLPVPFADSDAAVATAMLHGGEAFLAEHPHTLIAATAGDPAFFASLFGIQVPALNHPYWFVTFVGFDVNAEGLVQPTFWVAILDFETGAFAGSFSPVSRTRGLMLQTAAQAYVDDLGLAQDFAWIGLSTPALDPEGYAIPWTYTFHSTSTSTTVKVIYIGPSFVVHEVIENDQELDGTPELPHDVLNTNEALQIALEAGGAAFLETYPNSHIVLDGGYPPSAETGVAQEPVYTIIFNHVPEDASDAAGKVASFASLIVVAHMVTGEVIFRHAEGFDLPVDDAVATLVASEPAHGAVAVPGEATVRFTFDQPVDPYVVADLLEVHPEGALTFQHEAPYLSDDGRSVLFDVTHQPETDYVWVNWGGHRTTDGQVWTVPPFVVQYTTAAEAGAHTVSGSVVYAETAGKTSFRMHGEVAGLRDLLTARAEGLVASSASHPEGAVAKAGTLPNDPTHTVVVLLSCDPLTQDLCGDDAQVLGGTVVTDASGHYTIEHVRDGTYWPFAVRFFQPDLPEDVGPAYLGFYDADSDGAPDPVTVSGGSIEGLSLTLYDLFTLLAIPSDEAEGRAWTKAAEYAGDQELLGVLGFPQVDGRALVWYFAFRSASTSTLTVVEVGPFEDASETYPLDPNGPVFAMATLPEGYAASETVMAAAMAEGGAEFMATHEEAFIIATAGRIFQPHDLPVSPEALHRPHWIVLFAGQPIGQPHDDEPDYLIVIFDMEGQVVGRVTREDVASFQQRRERAHQILADLRLDNLMLVGMISPQISADGLSGAWQLAFYAEDRDLLVFVTLLGTDVVDVEVIEQAGLTDVQPLPQNLIDSPQALAAALEAGGHAFLERHPDAKIRFVAGYFLHGDVLGFAPHRVIAIIISDESEEGDPFDLGGADVASAGKASQAERFTAVLDPETGEVLATESTDTAVTVEDDPAMPLPDDFVVEQSYPNPAASRTTIPFELPESASVEIRLFDLQGRQMMTLTRGHFEAGRHEIGLDVSTLPSGAYFYEVRTGNGQRQTRMLMVLH